MYRTVIVMVGYVTYALYSSILFQFPKPGNFVNLINYNFKYEWGDLVSTSWFYIKHVSNILMIYVLRNLFIPDTIF